MGCITKYCVKGFFALAIIFGVLHGNAQEFRATLTGQVTDPSGAVIKGAKVAAVNTDTKTDRKSTRLNFSHPSISRMPSSA